MKIKNTLILLFACLTVQAQTNLFPPDGNVGIGTTNPLTKLNINVGSGGANGSVGLSIGSVLNYPSLELGIENDYDGMIKTYGNDLKIYAGHWKTLGAISTENHSISFHTSRVGFSDWSTAKMILNHMGNVGIGTTTPDEKLTVKGKIHAEEVRVDLNVPGPDYVFEQDYQLKSLPEIQAFIKENKHLPEVPSAKEMEEKGINLSEMNMLLLKKVEELTLYLIKQNEMRKVQESKLIKLEHQNQILFNIVEKLNRKTYD
ncbi:tail fiber protein [Pedobacter glucosidilyticus]|uniref:tail fiber protein n=1 Tax=Pedobacter glucosidilyticus TaxID=1122941 RepID=UPI0026EEE97D|nr:tail fiber protein [Pedobacter glucosidilyticus]